MAKSQKRSGREPKKPKADKKPVAATANAARTQAGPVAPSAKRGSA